MDSRQITGSILMDLSKAFDSMNVSLLLAKCEAYGMYVSAVSLLKSYLTGRHQRVKIGCTTSQWCNVSKGVPQGSVLGPILFNIFINDLFHFITTCDLYNYADDNSLATSDADPTIVVNNLTAGCEAALTWFKENGLQANPDKFQCIFLGPNNICKDLKLTIGDQDITSSDNVKLLGVTLDKNLNFNEHVGTLCRKAASQLNVLARLSKHLDTRARMHIFKSFVLANFNYCPLVWHFCSASATKQLEKIQERGLRFVFNDFTSSYECLLSKASFSTLHMGRIRLIACEVYKSLNGIGPAYMHDMFRPNSMPYNTRSRSKVVIPSIRTANFGTKSLKYEGTRIWNSLPIATRTAMSFSEFKELISCWTGPQCKCAMCK